MTRHRWCLAGVTMALAILAAAPPADAKRTGMNLACPNCHEGHDKPLVSVALSATRVEPGQSLTVTVTAKHATAKVGGVLVDSGELGAFEITDTLGTRLFDNTTTQATHSMPHPYVNGEVQFSFKWIAPASAGAAVLDVWSNAGNDNSKPDDDSAAEVMAGVSVGCDGAWYYLDADKDGAGAERTKVFSCTPLADRILQGGDCDDSNPNVSPLAAELCNSIDDDCDGKVDNGFTPVLLIADADGDGFGSTSGMSMIGCPPLAGFATTFDDCNDRDAAVHPGAAELANGRDDDCNGKVDDLSAGPAEPAPGGMAGSTGLGAPTRAPANEASCGLAAPARLQGAHWFGGALLVGWAHVRRSARRSRRASGTVALRRDA